MPHHFRASLIVSIAAAAAVLPTATTSAGEPVTVRFYDTFAVAAPDISKGLEVAGGILQGADVAVSWRDCSAGCVDLAHSGELLVRIVTAPPGAADGSMGCAVVDIRAGTGSLATIYADRIARVSSRTGLEFGTLLGRAVAHEIGHLLLGTADHSPSGLMRAVWSDHELQQGSDPDWRFTTADISRIRGRLDEVAHSRGRIKDHERT